MQDKICPVCNKPYSEEKGVETEIKYVHPSGKSCTLRSMPGNPNKDESTPPNVTRRKHH
jgi:hypothetical protein